MLKDFGLKSARELSADDHAECLALAEILDRIGDKWTIMVVGALADGPLRFNALQREVEGVSHRMLTLTLKGLQRDGMVSRRAFATAPPKVEYALTPRGQSLIEPLTALLNWAKANRVGIAETRASFDLASEIGEVNAA